MVSGMTVRGSERTDKKVGDDLRIDLRTDLNQVYVEREVEVESDQKEEGMEHLLHKGIGRNSID